MHLPLYLVVVTGLLSVTLPAQILLQELTSPREQESGRFGIHVASAPDTDGDGKPDLLISATSEGLGGRVHLYSGTTGTILHTFVSPNEEFGGLFGSSVVGLPDVNGDGRGDVLIGAYFEDPGSAPNNDGRAYIFNGSTGALLRMLVSPNDQADGFFGFSVASVPDADGDGIGDLFVGAYGEFDFAGRAYLFSGATGAPLRTLLSPNEEPTGDFGIAVAGVPDADGDRRGDLLVSAYFENQRRGRVYEFSGATGDLLSTLVSPNPLLNGSFGYGLAGVNDTNGDGRGDLLVGAYPEDFQAGRAYLFDGATGALLHELQSPHPETFGNFGLSVSGILDVDDDGFTDLLVGAQSEDSTFGEATDSGRAYIFSGATGLLLQTLTSPHEETSGHFGNAVAGVDDLDGDGHGEALVGAYYEDSESGPKDAGRAYLLSTGTGITLAVDTEPVDPPIIIPAAGGSFRYALTATNTGSDAQSVDLWTRISRPTGEETDKGVGPVNRTLAPGGLVTRTFTQSVPGRLPGGIYMVKAYVGTYPDGAVASDSFAFTKESAADEDF